MALGDVAAVLLSAQQLADFTRGYALGLLWACTTDDAGGSVDPYGWQSPDRDWALYAFDGAGQLRVMADAGAFVAAHREDLALFSALTRTGWDAAGHDLALTRGGHRAGFWSRGAGDVGDRLSVAARALGEVRGEVCGGVVSLV